MQSVLLVMKPGLRTSGAVWERLTRRPEGRGRREPRWRRLCKVRHLSQCVEVTWAGKVEDSSNIRVDSCS